MTVFMTTIVTGVQEFRLDIVVGPDPDDDTISGDTCVYFEADVDHAATHARRLLADHDGPDDRYGELWIRDGDGATADFFDTIHLG